MDASREPVLSIVVVIVSDTIDPRANVSHLAECLESLGRQVDPPSMEIIVPHHGNVEGIGELQGRFPHVRFLAVIDPTASAGPGGGREHHDVLRARGLSAARGQLVALLEDHGCADERWCANAVAAHRGAHAAVGGAIENGIDRMLNWAVYYCDFGRYENPLPEGESSFASDANVIYKRSILDSIRSTWEESFREVVVNADLASRGEKIVLDRSVVLYQNRTDLRLAEALRERYVWGRSYAETRCRSLGKAKILVYALAWPTLPCLMLVRMGITSWNRRRHFAKFVKVLPFIAMLLASWSVGEGVGYLKGLRWPR